MAYYKSRGITVLRVMTDTGSCYKSSACARVCRRLAFKQFRALMPSITKLGLTEDNRLRFHN